MAWVECNLCHVGEVVEDDNELEALTWYAQHMLEIHPHKAMEDSAVKLYIQIHTAQLATSNGGYHN